MLISNRHRWVKQIHPEILPDFGKSGTKKITQLLAKVDSSDISYGFAPLDEAFFEWFTPQYLNQVGNKKNFGGQDVIAKTLHRENIMFPYYSLTVFESGKPLGGVIFTLRENKLSVAYRVFRNEWNNHPTLRCSPALYAEYLLTKHAVEKNLQFLVHGIDKNPYGVFAAIGLATFKLSVGCHPETCLTHEVQEFTPTEYTDDILVFEYPKDSKVIENATLITTEAKLPKYEQLLKYGHLLKIKTVLMESEPAKV